MQRTVKTVATALKRSLRQVASAQTTAALVLPTTTQARSMTLYYNPPPIHSDAQQVVDELKKKKKIPDLDQKTSQDYIEEVPIIEVDGDVAVCDGGDGALGHPVEYIQLNQSVLGRHDTCKYCGLRYIKKAAHH